MKSILEENMQVLDDALQHKLSIYGFKKKKKYTYIRNMGQCEQIIMISPTKIRGRELYTAFLNIGLKYESVDRLTCILEGTPYNKLYSTSLINLTNVVRGGYELSISSDSDIEKLSEDIVGKVNEYGTSYWEGADTLEKFQEVLEKSPKGSPMYLSCGFPELTTIAMALILKNRSVEALLEKGGGQFEGRPQLKEAVEKRVKEYLAMKEGQNGT